MRDIIRFLMLAVLAFATLGGAIAAPARFQAPGYFRYALGDFVVTALQDGTVDLGTGSYRGLPDAETKELIARAFLLKTSGVQTSINAFLVDTGAHRILVDAGNAKCYGWQMGALTANLRAAGYKPQDIDIVVLTHLHGDHVCGLATPTGKRTFPNATVWAAAEEAAYWLSEDIAKAQPESRRIGFKQARDTLQLYGKNFHTFAPGDTIAAGMRIVPAPGHTPGHTAYLFESRNAAMLAWGDIVHCHPVQMPHPEVSAGSDVDRQQAVNTRLALFAQLAKDGTLIAGAHMPFPGLGHLRQDGPGYVWLPVEFGALPNEDLQRPKK